MSDDARRLAAEIADLRREVRNLATATRLGSSSVEDGTTEVYDDTDTLRQIIGAQADGTYTSIDLNAPAPPVPYPAAVSTQPGLLVISSFGASLDGSDWPLDFARIEVHVGATFGFTPSLASKVADFTLDGGLISVAVDPGTWYVTLVSVNTSGVSSEPAPYSSIAVGAPVTAGGVVTYHTDTAPVGLDAEDDGAIWYDTDAGNLPHRWDGATLAWVPLTIGGSALAADAIDGKTVTGALVRTAASGTRIELAGPDAQPFGDFGMLAFYHHIDTWNPGIIWNTHDDANDIATYGIQGPTPPGGTATQIAMTISDDNSTRTIAMNAKRTVINGGLAMGGLSREVNGFDFGTTSDTTNGSGQLVIPHNCGSKVDVVVLTNDQPNDRRASVVSKDDSTFTIEVRNGNGAVAANNFVSFDWVAIT